MTSTHVLHSALRTCLKSLLVIAGNSLLSVMFKVLHDSRVNAVDFLFQNPTKKKKKKRQVQWGLEIMMVKSTPDNALTKEDLLESCRYFLSTGSHPILLKPAIPSIILQHSNKLSKKFG